MVKHTVVMDDQALHEISYRLREQASPDDDIGILLSCVCSLISLETLWAQLEKLCDTVMLKKSLYNLVCASRERLTKVLLQQGITTKVYANINYYGKQWLIYKRVHLNNGIWKEMMHNSMDWLMTCKTFATYCAYCQQKLNKH